MGKNDISRRGLLHTYTDIVALIRIQANTPPFKDEVKKEKIISSQTIGGVNKGTHKVLKLTNKGCNYEQSIKERK